MKFLYSLPSPHHKNEEKRKKKYSESKQAFRPNEELTGNREGTTLQRYKIEVMGTSQSKQNIA